MANTIQPFSIECPFNHYPFAVPCLALRSLAYRLLTLNNLYSVLDFNSIVSLPVFVNLGRLESDTIIHDYCVFSPLYVIHPRLTCEVHYKYKGTSPHNLFFFSCCFYFFFCSGSSLTAQTTFNTLCYLNTSNENFSHSHSNQQLQRALASLPHTHSLSLSYPSTTPTTTKMDLNWCPVCEQHIPLAWEVSSSSTSFHFSFQPCATL